MSCNRKKISRQSRVIPPLCRDYSVKTRIFEFLLRQFRIILFDSAVLPHGAGGDAASKQKLDHKLRRKHTGTG